MEDVELKQCADFCSIALESITDNSENEVAIEFLEDVVSSLDDEELKWDALDAVEQLEAGETDAARTTVRQLNSTLLSEIDDL